MRMNRNLFAPIFFCVFSLSVSACKKNNNTNSSELKEDDIVDLLQIDFSDFISSSYENYFCINSKSSDHKIQYIKRDIDASKVITIPLDDKKTENQYELFFEVATGDVRFSKYYVTDKFSTFLNSIIKENKFFKVTAEERIFQQYLTDIFIYQLNVKYFVDTNGHLAYKKDAFWYRSENAIDLYDLYLEAISSYYSRPSHTDYKISFSDKTTFTYNGISKTIAEISSVLTDIVSADSYEFPDCKMTTELFKKIEENNDMVVESDNSCFYINKSGIMYNKLDFVSSNGESKMYGIKCTATREYHFKNSNFVDELFSLFEN